MPMEETKEVNGESVKLEEKKSCPICLSGLIYKASDDWDEEKGCYQNYHLYCDNEDCIMCI
jgi:hypothetical protein